MNEIALNGAKIIIKENATFEEWIEYGHKLKKVESGIQWLLGYWWNYGHEKWDGKAIEVAKKIGYSIQTCRHYGYVDRHVTSFSRLNDVSFSHHLEVAALKPEKQRYYLEKARDEKLSREKLRSIIQKETGYKKKETKSETHRLTLKRYDEIMAMVEEIIKMLNVTIPAHAPLTLLKNKTASLKDALLFLKPK